MRHADCGNSNSVRPETLSSTSNVSHALSSNHNGLPLQCIFAGASRIPTVDQSYSIEKRKFVRQENDAATRILQKPLCRVLRRVGADVPVAHANQEVRLHLYYRTPARRPWLRLVSHRAAISTNVANGFIDA